MNPFQTVYQYLLSVDPNAPLAGLVLTVFGAVYLARKFFPNLWELFATACPGLAKLDSGPALALAFKSWQALPGLVFGAALMALSTGGSVKAAITGALAGPIASLTHELLKAYKGGPGPVVLALLLVVPLSACSAAPPKPPCDPATLAGIVAECTTRIELECVSKGVPEEECVALKECDARLDARAEECRK